jgi:alpha-tubulin suppressor-like RCC1 family protein
MCVYLLSLLLLGACQRMFDSRPQYVSIASQNVHAVPVAVITSLRFRSLAAGYSHMCGLAAGKATAYCWGSNEYLQLGSSSGLTRCDAGATACSPAPLPVSPPQAFASLAASLRNSCGVDTTGRGWCWGFGIGGQLGNGLATDSATPVEVALAVPFSQIFLGGSGLIACGLTTAGTGWCWGPGGGGGGLGDGSTNGSDAPVAIAGNLHFDTLAVGDEHACGLAAGVAYCWGHDLYGALGAGVPGASSVPVPVAGGHTFAAIAAGLTHTCGIATDGAAWCWGFPPSVGSAVSDSFVLTPLRVAGNHVFASVSAGGNATCALETDGRAWCWGQNAGGVLGDGSQIDRPAPVPVATSVRFVLLRVGGVQACGLDAGGVAYCWGTDKFGSVGVPPDPGT